MKIVSRLCLILISYVIAEAKQFTNSEIKYPNFSKFADNLFGGKPIEVSNSNEEQLKALTINKIMNLNNLMSLKEDDPDLISYNRRPDFSKLNQFSIKKLLNYQMLNNLKSPSDNLYTKSNINNPVKNLRGRTKIVPKKQIKINSFNKVKEDKVFDEDFSDAGDLI